MFKIKKSSLENFSYLSILNLLNMIFPLIIIPLLLDRVGKIGYGIFISGIALSQILSVIIKLSYDLIGARDISLYRNDSEKKSKIYSVIIITKVILFFICFILYAIFAEFWYDLSKTERIIYYILFLVNLSDIFYATWYFQGIEKMKNITIIGFIQKIIYLGLIFGFVHTSEDLINLSISQSLSIILVCILSYYLVVKDGSKLVKVSNQEIKNIFKESIPLSAPFIINMLKERIAYIIIGKYFSYEMVTYYDIADKIRQVLSTPYSILSQIIYPKVAFSKTAKPYKKAIYIGFIFSILMYIILFITIEPFLNYYKNGVLSGAGNIVKLICLNLILTSISSYTGAFLIPLNLKKQYNEIFFVSFFFFIIFISAILSFHYLKIMNLTINNLLIGLFIINIINTLHFSYFIKKENIL